MKHRHWTSNQKFEIVMEGLKSTSSISELCTRYEISQSQYYQWRDRLTNDGAKLFDRGGIDHRCERQDAEIKKLKGIIGELTVELKKNEW